MTSESRHGDLRVVSLLSASTEIVARLGCADKLVGISHECDFPPSVLQLPSCSDPNMDPDAPSIAIDTAVRELVRRGCPVYTIYADKLQQLAPNVIITQDQCRVCAVSEGQLREAVDCWAAACEASCTWTNGQAVVGGAGIRIISLVPHSIADIQGDVRNIAGALGVPQRGERVAAQMAAVVSAVEKAVAEVRGDALPPRVACLEWIEPLMGCGHWHPELVEAAGGISVCGDRSGHVETLTLQQLVDTEPDVILFAPCGFDLRRSSKDLNEAEFLSSPEWKAMKAVRNGRVYVADGLTYFNRSSPRVVHSAEIMAEAAWPELAGLWGHTGDTLLTLEQTLAMPPPRPPPAHHQQNGSAHATCC